MGKRGIDMNDKYLVIFKKVSPPVEGFYFKKKDDLLYSEVDDKECLDRIINDDTHKILKIYRIYNECKLTVEDIK
jgi:hypothetical protein